MKTIGEMTVAETLERISADLGEEYEIVEALADSMREVFHDMHDQSALLLGAYLLRVVRDWEYDKRRFNGRPN